MYSFSEKEFYYCLLTSHETVIVLSKITIVKNVYQVFSINEGEVAQSCPTLCDTTDCNLPGSSIHGIFQARVLEWVAISFSISINSQTKIEDNYTCKP